jgi:chromosome segregation ATPase
MEQLVKANTLQTLQIYRKVEKTPSDLRLKRLEAELEQIRRNHPMPITYRHPERAKESENKLDEEIINPPRVKGIELQNALIKIENQLDFWVNDYRNLIDDLRELDRMLPKSHHDVNESEEQARENVEKIKKIEAIKDKLMGDFKAICIRLEEGEEKSKQKIRKLEIEAAGNEAKIESLEFEVKRLKRHAANGN